MKTHIVYRPNVYGGRLVYYRDQPTIASTWDALWSDTRNREAYRRAENGHVPRAIQKALLSRLKPGARILEAGCGLATFCIGANAQGFVAEGVDYAPEVIAQLQAAYPAFKFYRGDVRNLPVEDGHYDAIYSPGVCEHFEEGPEDVLAEAHRLCRRGGTVLVSTPCFNTLRRVLARCGHFAHDPRGHFYQYAFSPVEMTAILNRLGFDVVDVRFLSTLATLEHHFPAIKSLPLGPAKKAFSVAFDMFPPARSSGHTCLWTAIKR